MRFHLPSLAQLRQLLDKHLPQKVEPMQPHAAAPSPPPPSPSAAAPESVPEPAPARASQAAAPEPVPHPAAQATAIAQEVLDRMGIKLDLQAAVPTGFDMQHLPHLKQLPELMASLPAMPPFDLSNMKLPGMAPFEPTAPPQPMPGDARFISGSYRNSAGERQYKLYIPSCYHGQPLPLLVMLHGCTQNPDDFAAGTQMNQVAEERHCFVAYPEQSQMANQSKCWNWFNAIDQQRGQGEPSIIAGIARQIIDEYPVIESQVFVAGLSAGGAMAVIVGTLYPDVFAAVGVHSGLPFASARDLPSALSAMRMGANVPQAGNGTLPIIVFHGDRDTTVHPSNGDAVIAQGLHAHADDVSALVESGAVPNGHRYTQTTHVKQDGTRVGEHWVVHGAGHAWSGGSASGSYTDQRGPDASREMMRFFSTISR